MSNSYAFTCPYCGRDTTISDSDYDISDKTFYLNNEDKLGMLKTIFVVCPNPKCKKVSLSLVLNEKKKDEIGRTIISKEVCQWQLLPSSKAKVFPEYIPKAIKNDYEEACSIVKLSPKASATLSRRCIQGMIRDYWKVKKPEGYKGPWRLFEEIKAIKDLIEPDVWDAIDAVRSIGNIGAHMEENINLIIDVEPGEAEKLIGLIEMLTEEWYINKHKRQTRLAEIKEMSDSKKKQKPII